MKKLILLFACSLMFMSCEVEDDGPNLVMVASKVTGAELPEYFEKGKTYEIEVTYLLPDACHIPAGLQVNRGANIGNGRRDIFISGVASYEYGTTCDKEDENLEETKTFILEITEDEPYTFYLWQGRDENHESIYTEIVVPVGAPETTAVQ